MSGLFARAKPAGRDGVRYARSKHMGDILGASVIFEARAYRPIGPSIYCVLQVRGLSAEQPRSRANFRSCHVGMATTGWLYTPPDIIKRQAMRANLLAKATATNFGGFRSSSEASHGVGL